MLDVVYPEIVNLLMYNNTYLQEIQEVHLTRTWCTYIVMNDFD